MIKLARPGHWIKNVVVLAPALFSMRIVDSDTWLPIAIATVAFCLASSFAYIINDIKDAESDRLHPRKKDRPLASGRMSVKTALVEAVVVLILAGLIAYRLSVVMLVMVAVYVLLQVCYTELLKHKVLLDVICIAIGFVLRASAGAIAIGVEVSPWLFICMFTLCLFMGFCKRYSEFITLGDAAEAHRHRATLLEYSPELLTHLITVSAGIAVVSFLLYGLSDEASIFGGVYFIYTLPVVVYGIFRFAMLSMKGVYSDPTDLILHDRVFQITVVIWSVMAIAIIFYGSEISQFLQGLNR